MAEPALKSETPAASVAKDSMALVSTQDKSAANLQKVMMELEEKLANYKPALNLHASAANHINGRYQIMVEQPLEQFSRPNMQAYAVGDLSGNPMPYYAAICYSGLPYRHTSMEKLLNFDHPNLVRLVDHGIAQISTLGEQRHVLIFQKPEGRSLASLLADGLVLNEQRLLEQIITPLSHLLNALEDQGISHCFIHPSNIFLGEKLILGECISQPAGYAQEFIYEPIERITAIPQGKGGGSPKVDVYAIGIMVIEILYNLTRQRAMNHEQLVAMMYQQGCYNIMIGNGEFSEYFSDLLRGSLSDDPADRWGPAQLAQWITGKRFNIIHPSVPREASRPFSFNGKDYFNRKALAHALSSNWDMARDFIRTSKVERWLEQSILQPDDAAVITQILNMSGASQKNARRSNEILSRILIILDMSGPIRTEQLAFNTDAIGKMLSEAIYNKRQNDLNLLVDVIQNDLPHFWSDRQKTTLTQEVREAVWKIQTVRPSLMGTGFGFGIERCLYDLIQDLPCYSAAMKGRYVTTLPDFMSTLDALAAEHPKEFSLMDRHLASFAASRSSLSTDFRLADIAPYTPALAQNKELQVLMLFAKAQSKSGIKSLPGLSLYAAIRILAMLESIHSRRLRETFIQKIRQVAEEGNIQSVINTLIDTSSLQRDYAGFNNARDIFERNQAEITKLRDKDAMKKLVKSRADRWSSLISIFLFLIMCVIIMRDFLR